MRVTDFQILVGAFAGHEQRALNEAAFAWFEPLRLRLRDRRVNAPFRKIVVSLRDVSFAHWEGHVSNAAGVCEVIAIVESDGLGAKISDPRWMAHVVERSLQNVAQATGWRDAELESAVRELGQTPWPLVHLFLSMACVDRRTGTRCVPWLSTRPGHTELGVRIGQRDVPLRATAGPLYLEDEFPMAKGVIRDGSYVLLNGSGLSLAAVPLDAD